MAGSDTIHQEVQESQSNANIKEKTSKILKEAEEIQARL